MTFPIPQCIACQKMPGSGKNGVKFVLSLFFLFLSIANNTTDHRTERDICFYDKKKKGTYILQLNPLSSVYRKKQNV